MSFRKDHAADGEDQQLNIAHLLGERMDIGLVFQQLQRSARVLGSVVVQ